MVIHFLCDPQHEYNQVTGEMFAVCKYRPCASCLKQRNNSSVSDERNEDRKDCSFLVGKF